jgi:hypothetical protein
MASFKEFKVKITVDTADGNAQVEQSINTLAGFEAQIGALSEKIKKSKVGSDEFKELSKELARTEKAFGVAQNSGKSFLQVMSSAPGLLGTLGQSIQGAGKMFANFDMALKTSLVGFIAGMIAQLIEKFSKMEGVMDPINKIMGIFSAVMGKLANFILPPIAALMDGIAAAAENLGSIFGGVSNSAADLADRQDELSDSQATYELSVSKTSRALADAREKASDSTLSIKERKEAIMEAGKLERKLAEEGKARALEQARIDAATLAQTLGYDQKKIANIKKMTAVQLEAYAEEIKGLDGLDQEKRSSLLKQLGIIDEIAAGSSKIKTKENKALKALDGEAANNAKAAADKRREDKKAGIDAEITLENDAAKTSEKRLRELLEKKDNLANADLLKEEQRLLKKKKLSKDELEQLQDIQSRLLVASNARDKAVKDALKVDTDAAKVKTDLVIKGVDDKIKLDKQAATNEINEKTALLEQIKIKDGEKSESYKKAQLEIYTLQQKSIDDEVAALNKKKDLTEADKQRLKDLGIEAIKLANTIAAGQKSEIDAQVAKQQAQKKLDEDTLAYKFEKAEGDFEAQREIIRQQQELDQTTYDAAIKAAGDDKIKKGEIELAWTKKKGTYAKTNEDIDKKEFEGKIKMAQGIANVMNALSDLAGKETVAGKSLAVAASLINTYAAIAAQLKTAAGSPGAAIPGWAIAQAIVTGLAGFKAVRDIIAVQVPETDVPEVRIRKAMGGVLQGPTHAMGGISTPFGELEGGEMVVNRASTMMFRPQLETINSLGGGARDYNYSGFNGNINNNSEPPIIKTYVVASEMSSQQEIDRVILQRSKM